MVGRQVILVNTSINTTDFLIIELSLNEKTEVIPLYSRKFGL